MKVLQWILYLLLLGAFIWFVFFRDSNLLAKSKKASPANSKEVVANDNSLTDDEGSFVDELTEPDQNNGEGLPDIDVSKDQLGDASQESVAGTDGNTSSSEEEIVDDHTEGTSSIIDLNKKFLIVVGSFGKESNAKRMLKRVENSGKKGVITSINGLHRVVTASTDSRTDAKDLRAHFTNIYKERAFILEQ